MKVMKTTFEQVSLPHLATAIFHAGYSLDTVRRFVDSFPLCFVSHGPDKGKIRKSPPKNNRFALAIWKALMIKINPDKISVGSFLSSSLLSSKEERELMEIVGKANI